MQKIGQNVYVETGFRGCNVSFIVTSEGVVLIDTPQVPSEAKRWREEITKHGPIRYIINNEPHTDHVAGNTYFSGTVVSHEGSRKAMQQISNKMIEDMLRRIAPDSLPLPENYSVRTPDITFSQDLIIYLGGYTFKLILLPGHTPFQIATYIPEERIVFTSDNVVNGAQPFLHQAVPYKWLESLKELQKLEVDYIVPGHGAICDKNYLPKMIDIIETWLRMVKEAVDKGMTSEEAQDAIRVQDYFPDIPDDEFLKPMRRMMIGRIYDEVKRHLAT